MKSKGSGSKHSPITIDESEDEVALELCETGGPYPSPSPPQNLTYHTRWSQPEIGPQSRLSLTQVSQFGAKTSMVLVEDEDEPGIYRGIKRKRTNSRSHEVIVGSSHQTFPRNNPETQFSEIMSKKARKRQRRLERQAMEAEALARQEDWATRLELLEQPQMTSVPWLAPNGRSRRPPNNRPALYSEDALRGRTHVSSQPWLARPKAPRALDYNANIGADSTASTSSWVTSMAMAADFPFCPPMESRETTAQYPAWGDLNYAQLARHLHSVPGPISTSNATPVESEPYSLSSNITLPTSLPPPLIGMKPDQDPSSKHGLFNILAASPASQTEGTTSKPYIPNPARTLVMEQLPKSHRSTSFVNSWSKKACGAHPVYLSIDGPGAKALVEFATAELARKAWGSPRLGTAFAGLKPHQLKGRPREDLIRVWWYRVDGVGAGSGVGEIEEGEIEGDAGEKEVEVPVKKETKKERKARLAKERAAKHQKEQPRKLTTENVPQLPSNPVIPHMSQTMSSSIFPFLPASLYPSSSGTQLSGPSPMPPTYSAPRPHHPSHYQQTQGGLLSQSEIGAQWREYGESTRQMDRTAYGSSTYIKPSDNSPSDHSIASSRSTSPIQDTPARKDVRGSVNPPDPEDDMELDSPSSHRNASLQLPSQSDKPVIDTMPRSLFQPVSSPRPSVIMEASISRADRPILSVSESNVTTPGLSVENAIRISPSLVTPPVSASPTLSNTPPLAPSEPRAMKNAPKGPSYAKRSLLARQKELEERIMETKVKLRLASTKGETPSLAETPSASLPTPPPPDFVDKQLMEERLRSLVLQSQRNRPKVAPPAASASSLDSLYPASSSIVVAPPPPHSTAPAPTLSTTVHDLSLDDLAVSFITETIQTYKATPQPVAQPAKPSFTQTKLELAAKQKRLEQHISESKVMMAKLAQAQSKKEKDAILTTMRERSRIIEEESWKPHIPEAKPTETVTQQKAQPSAPMKWPDSYHDGGVLIVSDDEDDDSDEDAV